MQASWGESLSFVENFYDDNFPLIFISSHNECPFSPDFILFYVVGVKDSSSDCTLSELLDLANFPTG